MADNESHGKHPMCWCGGGCEDKTSPAPLRDARDVLHEVTSIVASCHMAGEGKHSPTCDRLATVLEADRAARQSDMKCSGCGSVDRSAFCGPCGDVIVGTERLRGLLEEGAGMIDSLQDLGSLRADQMSRVRAWARQAREVLK